MSLIFNGVTIPEDAENVINFNGVDIKSVIFNGVEVWKYEIPFDMQWSGNSYSSTDWGLETSGALCRFRIQSSLGAWATVNASGVWDNVYTYGTIIANSEGYMFSNIGDIQMHIGTTPTNPRGGKVTFDVVTGFSGSTGDPSWTNMETSGGQVRIIESGVGAWITLT